MAERQHDFPARGVALVLLASVVFLGLAVGSVWWLFPGAHPSGRAAPAAFDEPILEIRPVERYGAWLTEQQDRLAGAGARTPIDQAIRDVAGRGAAAYDPGPLP